MQTNIVATRPTEIRREARDMLKGHWREIVIFMAIYYLISTTVSDILNVFFYTTQTFEMMGETYVMTTGYASGIYTFLISGPMTFSLGIYVLHFVRGRNTQYSMIVEGFSHFGKTFVLMLWMEVRIALWTMLLIIPGVIAMIRYSQAFYVLADHPDYSPNQCINASKRMMKGNKSQYFLLYLSFIGWFIVAMIPGALFDYAAEGLLNVALMYIMAIPVFFLNAYVNVSTVIFYELAHDESQILLEEGEAGEYEDDDGND